MSKQQFLKYLFNAHVSDLNSFSDKMVNYIFCPICFQKLYREQLLTDFISDGHVWPNPVRIKSNPSVLDHRVLICKNCNNRSGELGEAHVKILEKVKVENKSGFIEDRRNIKLISYDDTKEHNIRASVNMDSGINMLQISSKTNNKKIIETLKVKAKNNVQFALVIPPPQNMNVDLALVGWLTSAYLFAFYVLGYPYIFSKDMDIVRSTILSSFKKGKFEFPVHKILRVNTLNNFFYDSPVLRLVIPLNRIMPSFLQVRMLDVEIDLPFPVVPHKIEDYQKSVARECTDFKPKGDGIPSYVMKIPVTAYNSKLFRFTDDLLGRARTNQLII